MSAPVASRASAERMVVAATMGPTFHHVHAWRFVIVPGLIEVHADPARFRSMDDPEGRGVHLGCGAALVNLRLAAAQLGHEAVVRPLPDTRSPTVLARVRLAGRHRVTRDERLLYAAALRPAPSRRPVPGVRPPAPVINELGEAARLEGAIFHLLPAGPGEGRPQQAVLTTQGDSPAEWLRAGQALQHVLLSGTALSVSTSFLYETIDIPEIQDMTQPGESPQVLLELVQQTPST